MQQEFSLPCKIIIIIIICQTADWEDVAIYYQNHKLHFPAAWSKFVNGATYTPCAPWAIFNF